ncbi:hypothetical protein [Flavobacterium sp. RS13.1]|uniref:hypothetical protein n=1 Tax=Flavobacterium sp. RS13.1 TaxID=3400345 RepID=UPI003AAB659D
MNINKRIEEIINTLFNGKKSHFANKIGVSPTVVENIVGTRQGKPSFGVLEKIAFAIENINTHWLLTGTGTMIRKEKKETINNEYVEIKDVYSYKIDSLKKELVSVSDLLESKQETIETQKELIKKLKEEIKRQNAQIESLNCGK